MKTFDEWMATLPDRSTYSDRDVWHAAQAQCAAGPWRPISEAPKDGRRVLLRKNAGYEFLGRWAQELEAWFDGNGLHRDPIEFAELREGKP